MAETSPHTSETSGLAQRLFTAAVAGNPEYLARVLVEVDRMENGPGSNGQTPPQTPEAAPAQPETPSAQEKEQGAEPPAQDIKVDTDVPSASDLGDRPDFIRPGEDRATEEPQHPAPDQNAYEAAAEPPQPEPRQPDPEPAPQPQPEPKQTQPESSETCPPTDVPTAPVEDVPPENEAEPQPEPSKPIPPATPTVEAAEQVSTEAAELLAAAIAIKKRGENRAKITEDDGKQDGSMINPDELGPYRSKPDKDKSRGRNSSRPSRKKVLIAGAIVAGLTATGGAVVTAVNNTPPTDEQKIANLKTTFDEKGLIPKNANNEGANNPFATVSLMAAGRYALLFTCKENACVDSKGAKTSSGTVSQDSDKKPLTWSIDFTGNKAVPMYLVSAAELGLQASDTIVTVDNTADGKPKYTIHLENFGMAAVYPADDDAAKTETANENQQTTASPTTSTPTSETKIAVDVSVVPSGQYVLQTSNAAYVAEEAEKVNQLARDAEALKLIVKAKAIDLTLRDISAGNCNQPEGQRVTDFAKMQLVQWLISTGEQTGVTISQDQIGFDGDFVGALASNTGTLLGTNKIFTSGSLVLQDQKQQQGMSVTKCEVIENKNK